MTAKDLQKALRAVATPERATTNAWFFKSGPGQYGEGDIFIGVTVPASRAVAKNFYALGLEELSVLLHSKIHEDRLTALHILVHQFETGTAAAQKKIYQFYLSHTARINNWDLVDSSAGYIVGAYLYMKGKWQDTLKKLAQSKSLWERRIAIVATSYFIKQEEYESTLAIATMLLPDTHDLIQKASGWMLREMGKKDEDVLCGFLDMHAATMPRTTLRYAIERLTHTQKKHYMQQKSMAREIL